MRFLAIVGRRLALLMLTGGLLAAAAPVVAQQQNLADVPGYSEMAKILASVAVVFAMINVVGGFLVTHRMLGMFSKKK